MKISKLGMFGSLCLTAALTTVFASSSAGVTSTFDTGLEGWAHAPGDAGSTVTYSATAGNPGGAAVLTDAAQGVNDYFLAPGKYLGNDSADLNGVFSFQLNDNSSIDDLATPLLVITDAAGDTLTHSTPATFTAGSYNSFSFALNQSGGFTYTPTGGTGAAATLANVQTVLANVASLQILGDFHNGSEATALDNVALVPEPGTLATAGFSLIVGLGWLRRSRRQA